MERLEAKKLVGNREGLGASLGARAERNLGKGGGVFRNAQEREGCKRGPRPGRFRRRTIAAAGVAVAVVAVIVLLPLAAARRAALVAAPAGAAPLGGSLLAP